MLCGDDGQGCLLQLISPKRTPWEPPERCDAWLNERVGGQASGVSGGVVVGVHEECNSGIRVGETWCGRLG